MTKPSSKEWLAKTATQRNHPAITNSAAEKKIDQEEPKSEVHSELNPPRKKRLDWEAFQALQQAAKKLSLVAGSKVKQPADEQRSIADGNEGSQEVPADDEALAPEVASPADHTMKTVVAAAPEDVEPQAEGQKEDEPPFDDEGELGDDQPWQEEPDDEDDPTENALTVQSGAVPYPAYAFGSWAPLVSLIARAIQVAPEMVGSALLAILAALIQPLINVSFRATGKGGPTSLNMLIIAASGERKSSTMDALAAPVYKAIRQAEDARRTMIVQDVTVDGLAVGLINRCPSQFILAVEGASLLGGHAMNKENLSRFLGNVSSLFSGEAITRTRVDEHHYAEDRRLSVLIFAQPIVAMEFLSSELVMQQGLGYRFSICQPPSLLGSRKHVDVELEREPVYLKYCEEIAELARQEWKIDPETGGVDTRTVRMSPNAKERWVEVADTLEEAAGPGGDMATHAGYVTRYPEQILRMAALLAMIENPQVQVIEEKFMLRAIDLGNYYLASALDIFNTAPANKDEMEAQTLLDWMRHKLIELSIAAIPVRMMYKDGPRCARSTKRTNELLKILEDRGEVVKYEKAVVYGADRKRSGNNYAVV